MNAPPAQRGGRAEHDGGRQPQPHVGLGKTPAGAARAAARAAARSGQGGVKAELGRQLRV
jgi:hypothetical protein